jgi:hypothetical protein
LQKGDKNDIIVVIKEGYGFSMGAENIVCFCDFFALISENKDNEKRRWPSTFI